MKQSKIDRLTNYYNAEQGMTERKLKNRLAKEEAKEKAQRNQKPVKSMKAYPIFMTVPLLVCKYGRNFKSKVSLTVIT
jgi:hypothetical protein